MVLGLSSTTVALLAGVVIVAGAVNGVAGFGFALVGTMTLATVVDPSTAVVVMLLPIVAVNLSLAGDLSRQEVRRCGRRFWPLLGAALVGTLIGLVLIDRIPAGPLRVGLGAVTIGFVATSQNLVALPPLGTVRDRCFVEAPAAMAGVGGVAGLLFGGTNVGVQFVAYLRGCDLRHDLFVGVVALLFLGLNGVRVVAAGLLGLYPDVGVFLASLTATVPGVAGVAVGRLVRGRVAEATRRAAVLMLLTVIGVRLVAGGLGLA